MRTAITSQWQVAALLLVLCGLTIGMAAGAGPFLDTGLNVLAPLLLAPVMLSTAATRLGAYRIAAVLSALGAGLTAFGFWLVIVTLPAAVIGFGAAGLAEGATVAAILIAATRFASTACQILWHAEAPQALPAPHAPARRLIG